MAIDLKKIKSLRERKGWSQAQAAMAAGLSESENSAGQRWSAIESGRKASITVDTLERIAAALGVKAKDLLK
jgi:transcriptional regulator with XRE-family HTH domain